MKMILTIISILCNIAVLILLIKTNRNLKKVELQIQSDFLKIKPKQDRCCHMEESSTGNTCIVVYNHKICDKHLLNQPYKN